MRARLTLGAACLALLYGSALGAVNVTRGNVQTYTFEYFGAAHLPIMFCMHGARNLLCFDLLQYLCALRQRQ